MGDLQSPVIGFGSFVIGELQILRFHRSNLFFTADFKSAGTDKLIGSSSAVSGTASCAVSETMVIAKFGDNAIKVAIK